MRGTWQRLWAHWLSEPVWMLSDPPSDLVPLTPTLRLSVGYSKYVSCIRSEGNPKPLIPPSQVSRVLAESTSIRPMVMHWTPCALAAHRRPRALGRSLQRRMPCWRECAGGAVGGGAARVGGGRPGDCMGGGGGRWRPGEGRRSPRGDAAISQKSTSAAAPPAKVKSL